MSFFPSSTVIIAVTPSFTISPSHGYAFFYLLYQPTSRVFDSFSSLVFLKLRYWVIQLVWQMGLSFYTKTMGCRNENKLFSESEYLTVLLSFKWIVANLQSNTQKLKTSKNHFHQKWEIFTRAIWPSYAFPHAISERIELESWDWLRIKDEL